VITDTDRLDWLEDHPELFMHGSVIQQRAHSHALRDYIDNRMPAPAEEPASEPGCLCDEINARHCPVHQEPLAAERTCSNCGKKLPDWHCCAKECPPDCWNHISTPSSKEICNLWTPRPAPQKQS
jgi:hypothetical protein